jgi:serine protease Do
MPDRHQLQCISLLTRITRKKFRLVFGMATMLLSGLAASACLAVPAAGAPAETAPAATPGERMRDVTRAMFATARERVFPALVNIHVVTVNYADGKERKAAAVGSGTIITPEGHVVTNQHVTNNGKRFHCTLADHREASAALVGEDPLTDIAVLKLNLDELGGHTQLPVAQFGNSDELIVGDYVMAMGSPFSLARSVTLGIVSNTERVFGGQFGGDEVEDVQLDPGQRTGVFTNWIQHDALINPGNSGGPLVNLKGEIIGINELGGKSLGFAIPSNLARHVVDQLIAHGEVPRSDIGVAFKPILRTGLSEGVLVNSVAKEGPAGKAGIQAGDVLLKLNDDPLTVRWVERIPSLLKRIADLPIGSQIQVTYRRGEQLSTTTVTTEKLEADRGAEAAFRGWGLTAMQVTPKLARDNRLNGDEGLLVTSICPGGPAASAQPPLEPGDVVHSIDNAAVREMPDMLDAYRELANSHTLPREVLVEFDRHGQDVLTTLKPKFDSQLDPPREIRKAWLGIATQPMLPELAARLGYPGRSGFRITRVYPHTEAAAAGLRVGDVVVGLNGERVAPRGLQDEALLARQIRRLDLDGTAMLTVLRDGRERRIELKLERTRTTAQEARRQRDDDFELSVRELTFFDRDMNRWDDDLAGVLVESVGPAGWAGLAGLRAGDVILRIAGDPVSGVDSFRAAIEDVKSRRPERVEFLVLRGARTHLPYAEPEWSPAIEHDHSSLAARDHAARANQDRTDPGQARASDHNGAGTGNQSGGASQQPGDTTSKTSSSTLAGPGAGAL